jgi:hypothetical protein
MEFFKKKKKVGILCIGHSKHLYSLTWAENILLMSAFYMDNTAVNDPTTPPYICMFCIYTHICV